MFRATGWKTQVCVCENILLKKAIALSVLVQIQRGKGKGCLYK